MSPTNRNWALISYATIIIDKSGIIRFEDVYNIASASKIIRELQGI